MTPSSRGVLFCDVCGESVPSRDLEGGLARRRGDRVLCALHAGAIASLPHAGRARPSGLGGLYPVAAFGAFVVAGASLLIVLVIRAPDADELDLAAARTEAALSARLEAGERAAGTAAAAAAEERRALESRLEGAEARLGALAERADELSARVSDAEAKIAVTEARSLESGSLAAALVESLRAEVESLREAAARERAAREAAAAPAPPSPAETDARTADREADEQRRRLVSTDPAVRFSALVEIAKRLGPDSARDVAAALSSDADPFIRAFAARLLGDFRSRESVPDLVVALRDADSDVRRASVQAVHAIAGSDFGFDPDGPEDARTIAIRRVEEWFRAESRSR